MPQPVPHVPARAAAFTGTGATGAKAGVANTGDDRTAPVGSVQPLGMQASGPDIARGRTPPRPAGHMLFPYRRHRPASEALWTAGKPTLSEVDHGLPGSLTLLLT